jgi:UDP-glucuronate 4-epimerase
MGAAAIARRQNGVPTMSNAPILVTGAAGFIGAYVCRALRQRGDIVHGIDNFNSYYEPRLKRDRVAALCAGVDISVLDIADASALQACFDKVRPRAVIHLAAQAGVRYSLESPSTYVQSNLVGFGNMLEACRQGGIRDMVYASSSSVYGGSAVPPFDESQRVDQPLSLYAATKAANELMAHSYAHLFRLRLTGLRFFTVYGPWGRPDMAPILFSRAALAGRPVDVFNHGDMRRDFTWIDDIVAGVIAALDRPPHDDAVTAPHRVYNLGNHRPEALQRFIDVIELAAGRKVERHLRPMQAGDMVETMADTQRAQDELGFLPGTHIEQGLPQLVGWCRSYYGDQA